MPNSVGLLNEGPGTARARLKALAAGLSNPLTYAALLTLALCAAVNWFRTAREIVRDYNPLPVWDYWQVAEHLERYRAFDLSVFWSQHNEHRIVFPEAVFAADMLFFGGHQIFSLLASFLCYFGVWLILALAINSDKELSRNVRAMSILLAGIVIGWQGSAVVLGNTFLLQWTMLQLSVSLSLFLLALSRKYSHSIYFSLAIFFAVIANYSSGNGMLLWPVLLVASLVMKLPPRRIVILALCALVSTSLFFVGYRSSNDFNIFNLAKHPIYLLGFLSSFVSVPIGVLGQPHFGVIVGALNLFTFALLLWFCVRKALLASTLSVVLFGSFLFTLASALLTAAGRMNPQDPYFIAAKAARYISLPLVNWAVLLVASIWISARLKWRLMPPVLIALLWCFFLIRSSPEMGPWLNGNGSFVAEQQVATLGIENDIFDPEFEGRLYSDPGFVSKFLPVLQRYRLSIYSSVNELSWLGRKLRERFEPCDHQMRGSVSAIYPVQGGFEIVGNVLSRNYSPKVVFVNQRGEIVGFGERITAGQPAVMTNPTPYHYRSWLGFVNSKFEAKQFSTFVLAGDGQMACLLSSNEPLPEISQVAASDVIAPISGITWSGAGWIKNTLPPRVTEGDPIGRVFWSSWNGSDQSTGRIASSEIEMPANHCVVLQILHGPSSEGLTAEVLRYGTAEVIERIPLRTGERGWKLWKIPLPSQARSIQIIGDDRGSGWGEWLAIASPLQCR